MRGSVGVWNNANTWVITEWYLHVAGYVFLLIVGACVVVCVVLVVCAAVKTGVEDVSNIHWVGVLVARMLLLTVVFWKATCYTVMVLFCTRVHQLDVYCHSTVLLLFWILSYLRVKWHPQICPFKVFQHQFAVQITSVSIFQMSQT